MTLNPYSTYSRRDDEVYDRQALIDALEEPPMTARPRTPARTPQQTREMLDGPGGRTAAAPDADTGGNDYSGPVDQDLPDARSRPPAGTSTPFNRGRGYELLDDYDDGYDRRLEGSPSVAGNAAKYGMAAGNVVPGWGHAIGAIGGAVGAAFAKNAKSAMTDFSAEDARAIISRAHKDALGRDITPEYLDQIMIGQGWKPGDKWFGEQPLAYVLDQFGTHAQQEGAQRAATPEAAPTAAAPVGAAGPSRYAMEGFDLQRAQDPSFSAKDAFAQAVQAAPEPPPGEDKAALGAWFTQYVQPFMESQGFTINSVQGDKINITGPQGTGTIDWYRGAGAPGGALAWQPEGAGGTAGGGAITGSSGATSIQDAYAWLKQNADPSWTREEMQAAINAAFADVPGFVEGYAGDAVFENGKLDLITNFEGPGASWSDNLSLIPLHGGGSPAGASGGGTTAGLNLAPGVSLAAPLGNSDVYAQIQAALQRLLAGTSTRDELLQALGG